MSFGRGQSYLICLKLLERGIARLKPENEKLPHPLSKTSYWIVMLPGNASQSILPFPLRLVHNTQERLWLTLFNGKALNLNYEIRDGK